MIDIKEFGDNVTVFEQTITVHVNPDRVSGVVVPVFPQHEVRAIHGRICSLSLGYPKLGELLHRVLFQYTIESGDYLINVGPSRDAIVAQSYYCASGSAMVAWAQCEQLCFAAGLTTEPRHWPLPEDIVKCLMCRNVCVTVKGTDLVALAFLSSP